MRELREPPGAEAGEHRALVGDRLVEDDVEGAQAIGGDEEQMAVVDLEGLAHLPAVHERQPGEVRGCQGHIGSLLVSSSALDDGLPPSGPRPIRRRA